MNMIAAVAKAIEDNIAAALPDGIQLDWQYAAKAAIGAMRDPTESMEDAGYDAAPPYGDHNPLAAWKAMIDAALEEK